MRAQGPEGELEGPRGLNPTRCESLASSLTLRPALTAIPGKGGLELPSSAAMRVPGNQARQACDERRMRSVVEGPWNPAPTKTAFGR